MDAPRFEAECAIRHGKDSANERHGKEKNEVFSMSCPSAARSARRFFQDIYGWLLLLDQFGIIAFIQVSVVYRA